MAKSELNANQKKALAALLATTSVTAAAARCGLAERTLYYYLADEVFKAELRARQDGIMASVTSALVGLSGQAVEVLASVLGDPEASDPVRVRAALGWLSELRRGLELEALADRVAALEERSGGYQR